MFFQEFGVSNSGLEICGAFCHGLGEKMCVNGWSSGWARSVVEGDVDLEVVEVTWGVV